MGKMRLGTKSDLVGCLENLLPPRGNATAIPPVEVKILDGAAIVNMLAPGNANTLSEYASQIFLPYITSQLEHTSRVDIVWDEYLPDSLKADTRNKRSKGIRRRVEPSSSIPGNCQAFLRIDEDKVELFAYLASRVATTETEKQIITTHHKDVFCTQPRDSIKRRNLCRRGGGVQRNRVFSRLSQISPRPKLLTANGDLYLLYNTQLYL